MNLRNSRSFRRGLLTGSGLALALTSAGAVHAQEIVITAHPAAETLTAPTMAGSRLNLTPLETPSTVQVISGDSIRNWELLTVTDAVTRAPGFTSAGTPGNGGQAYSVRGFFGANSVAELFNGVQLFNAGGVVTYPFDPWNVDRIEMLYGPASVLYGSGAIGGALDVVPRNPDTNKEINDAEIGGGSYNTFHEAIDSTGPLGRGLAYRVDISNQNSNGWVQRSQSSSIAASGSLQWDASPQLRFKLSDDFGEIKPSSYEGTPLINGNQIVPGAQLLNYNIESPEIDFRQNRTFLAANWETSPNLTFNNQLYDIYEYRRYLETYTYTYAPATQTVKRTNYRNIVANQTQVGDHGFATYKQDVGGFKNEAVVGFDINQSRYDRFDNTNAAASYGGSSTVNALSFSAGTFATGNPQPILHQYTEQVTQYDGFAEDRLSLTDQLSLVAGLRYDGYGVRRDDFIVHRLLDQSYQAPGWHVGVVYAPIKDLSLYGQYSAATDPVTSFASQSVSNFGFGLSPGREWEAGVKQSLWNGQLQWTFDGYYIVKNNLLTADPTNPSITDQVGQQSSRGVEGSVIWTITDHFSIDANGTVLNARFDSYNISSGGKAVSLAGYRPYMVPQQTANLHGYWDFNPQWQVRVGVQYVGDRYADNTDISKMPAYTLLELGVRWIAMPGLKFDLRLSNVANVTYAASNATGNTTQWILGEPRNVMLSVNKVF
jgi:iron complex outermembrane receptor protein